MKRKFLSFFIIALAILFFMPINSFAITPTFKYSCSRGTHIYYNIEAGNVFKNHIKDAVYNWEHTGHGANPIYMYEKNNTKGTAIDFIQKKQNFFRTNTVLGETRFFNGKGQRLNPDESNWLYSHVYLSLDTLAPNPYYAKIQGTIAHEIGHAFGLAHYNNNPFSIMCQAKTRQVQRVQKEDNDAIIQKYGKR